MINWNNVPYWVKVVYFERNNFFFADKFLCPTEIDLAPPYKFGIPKKYLRKMYFYTHRREDTFIKFTDSGNIVECFGDKWFICHDELPCKGEYYENAFETCRLDDVMEREFGQDYFLELYKEGST